MKLLSIKEAAKALSLSPRTLYQWHWKGKDFPFIRVGRVLRISEDDLLQFIERGKERISRTDRKGAK